MSLAEGFAPVTIDQFGGLCTLVDRSDLPNGTSPDCQNVEFFPGGVKTRQSIQVYRALTSAPASIKTYIRGDNTPVRLIWTTDGTLYQETAANAALTTVTSAWGSGTVMKSVSAFGKEWICLSDGNLPLVHPFKWDGTTLSPITRSGGTFSTPPNLVVTPGCDLTPGVHNAFLSVETTDGQLCPPGLLYSVTVPDDGVSRLITATVGSVPGAGVSKYRTFLSLADSSDFYNVASLTWAAYFSSSDDVLATGLNGSQILSDITLSPCIGVMLYKRRLLFWGERTSRRREISTDTNGALITIGIVDTDFGAQAPGTIGGAAYTTVTAGGAWVTGATGTAGPIYRITGDGATVKRGEISQQQTNNSSGTGATVAYLETGKRYGIRARLRKSYTAANGGIRIEMFCDNANPPTTQACLLSLTGAQLSTEWAVYEGTSVVSSIGSASGNVKVDIYGSSAAAGTAIPNNETVDIDWYEPYEISAPGTESLVRVSRPDDPEGINSIDGFLVVGDANAQRVRALFELRGTLYICKERSLYATSDNGDVPATWSISEVSSEIGTPSVNGVGMGDGWAVIVGDSGAYRFDGGFPDKISQEIEPTWGRINWAYGHKVWCVVDVKNKRVRIGVPIDGATSNNALLECDFVEGWDPGYATGGSGRKWAIQTGSFDCAEMTTRDDRSRKLLMGCSTAMTLNNAVTNSESYSFTPWVATSGSAAVTTGYSDPAGGTAAGQWVVTGAGVFTQTVAGAAADDYVFGSVWLKGSGGGTVTFTVGAGTKTESTTVTLSSSWQLVRLLLYPAPAGTTSSYIQIAADAGTTLQLFGYQLDYGATYRYWRGYAKKPGGMSGTVYGLMEFVADDYNDSTSAMSQVYETAPTGQEMGRSVFDRLVLRIRGRGRLAREYVRPSGDYVALRPTWLSTAPDHDEEDRKEQIDTQIGTRLTMSGANAYFSIRRLSLFARPAEHGYMRGR